MGESAGAGRAGRETIIVSGGDDATVRIWEARTGQQRGQPLTGHDGTVRALALGELDGETIIVSGGWDGAVQAVAKVSAAAEWPDT